MKINENYLLREVAGNYIVVSIGDDSLDLGAIITVNEIGAIIWRGIEEGKENSEIVKSILSEYDIDEATASADFDEFCTSLKEKNSIIE